MNTQIYEEASEWVVQHRTGELGAQDRRRFDAWLRQSPQHVSAYLEMSSIWEGVPQIDASLNPTAAQLIEQSRVDSNVVPLGKADPFLSNTSIAVSKRRNTTRLWYSIAATALLSLGIAGWLYEQRGVYATGIGEQRTVTLADGSVVELNSKSRIKVRYSQRERSIDLLQGQALFRVAKDPNKPFIVASAGTYVRAVGTQFDVYKKSAGTVVTVVEGRVAVTGQRSRNAAGAPPLPNHEPQRTLPATNSAHGLQPKPGEVLLAAGEQLLIADAVSVPQPANIEAVTAWTQQRLVFDYTPLAEVAEEFNRYNQRRLVIEDRGLQVFHVSGSFSSTDPTLLLRFLRDQPGILVNETPSEIRISRREAGAG